MRGSFPLEPITRLCYLTLCGLEATGEESSMENGEAYFVQIFLFHANVFCIIYSPELDVDYFIYFILIYLFHSIFESKIWDLKLSLLVV